MSWYGRVMMEDFEKREAKRKIDEATARYREACATYPLRHPERERAFKEYKRARQECTPVLYGERP